MMDTTWNGVPTKWLIEINIHAAQYVSFNEIDIEMIFSYIVCACVN